MKKTKPGKTFNLKYLQKHLQNENSGIYLHKIKDHLAIHPYHLNDLNTSVTELLNRKIGKYCPHFGGILCGYKNIKLLSEAGRICDDSYFIHIDIEAEFFIFDPTGEKLLYGVVNKKSKDHVGCLVHNIFNVSLPKPRRTEDWIGDSLELNSEVELKITYTDFDGKLPYMKGEIVSVLGGEEHERTEITVGEEGLTVEEVSPTKSVEKKKKSKKRSKEVEESEVPPKKRKKSSHLP